MVSLTTLLTHTAWTANEALNYARPRDEVRTVELVLVDTQVRLRLVEHEATGQCGFSQQRFDPRYKTWRGRVRWTASFAHLSMVLTQEERQLLEATGWKPAFFTYPFTLTLTPSN
ncbi:hypothetical protein [Ktedonobacter robiniae]|uniref:Uncharacterized protein n=1 Tax=Ktedonobacter robiniae TaxID=2778365 RepID=A0ABQ3V3Y6_9CHLR|nr:hypothetical protein [Ktedonobacter robiniae]GHO59185.1 hypothetical protein KSB_76600 [Ktedonobacter robiniae]